jgi:hypothetical protein
MFFGQFRVGLEKKIEKLVELGGRVEEFLV